MKAFLISLMILCLADDAMAQYTVTKVNGRVVNKTSGAPLVPGSKLRDEDLLEFSSPNDMVRVIVSGKGIYVISPGPRKGGGESVIVEMLKSALKIKSKEGYLSGRSEEDELVPVVLQSDQAINPGILVTDINKYQFDPKRFDISDGSRFFLQKQLPGARPVIVPLKTSGDTLIVYATDFDTARTSTYKLGFFSKQKNSSELLADVLPVMGSTEEMEVIIRLIAAEYMHMEKSLLYRNSFEEIYESMGKPSVILFREKFDRVFREVTETEK